MDELEAVLLEPQPSGIQRPQSLSLGDERVMLARKPSLVTQSPNGAVPESQARAATS